MRILSLRFKNLNSLEGEWEIDLTRPEYTEDGIFAITGPTGAGKSTILDALCLALYGRTPRLKWVSKSTNEIMSRQAGECFAEVTFQTQKNSRYRCHWSQHRAKKKAGGPLQQPKHEIADAQTGALQETRLQGVAKMVEDVTGLDFDRFTRSMLLAQGGFAAFLQADADERTPILEQITGTQSYSTISKRVHDRKTEERRKLDLLQSELNGIQVLSEEEESGLRSLHRVKTDEVGRLDKLINTKKQAIVWLEGMTALERELESIATLTNDLNDRINVFQVEQRRLEKAQRALELEGVHAGLVSIRRQQQEDEKSHTQTRQELVVAELKLRQAELAMKQATELLEQKKTEFKLELGIIATVREFDLKIKEKLTPINAAQEALNAVVKMKNDALSQQKKDSHVLDKTRTDLVKVLRFLDENKNDAELIEQLNALRNRFDEIVATDRKHRKMLTAFQDADKRKNAAVLSWERHGNIVDSLMKDLERAETSLARLKDTLSQRLQGRDIGLWRDELNKLKDRKLLLKHIAELVKGSSDDRRILIDLGRRRTILEDEINQNSGLIEAEERKISSIESDLEHLETQMVLLNRIQDLEEKRQHLQDGEPCPLCGSPDHPFARGNVPGTTDTKKELDIKKHELNKSRKIHSGLVVKHAEAIKELEQIRISQFERETGLNTTTGELSQCLTTLGERVPDDDPIEEILQLQNDTELMLKKTSILVQDAEKEERELQEARDARDKASRNLAQSERELQDLVLGKETAIRDCQQLSQGLQELADQDRIIAEQTGKEVARYGIQSVPVEKCARILADLTDRRDRWQKQMKEKDDGERKVATLEVMMKNHAEHSSRLEFEWKEKERQLAGLVLERDGLMFERQRLYGQKDTSKEEQRMTEAVTRAEKDCERLRITVDSAMLKVANLKVLIDRLENSIQQRQLQMRAGESDFQQRLLHKGFERETEFLEARLPEEKRKTLIEQADNLAKEQADLGSRREDRIDRLAREREKGTTDLNHDQLIGEVTVLASETNQLQLEIGGIHQRLKDNELFLTKKRHNLKAFEIQKTEFSRWETLHGLIGSADGKKYRNFAQGLTFEMMIRHANRQLQNITDRYLLVRDKTTPLDLNVIDNYQAGEIRSTRNLSGGESFLVSLALALGLSRMASQNVRVDSLFLDEGFGSLDEHALDSALETLAGLKQEGKLIGVISHVPALKERIGTQISVIPSPGGRSTLQGPGCKRNYQ